ncbi:DDE_3 domain-containing protein [Trichonephila clavipes]|uniref:DDE_3 domain-containing protein n=1 Tax=Trichonephila clavipes TaxID=2585209 RepID=A0A8X6SKV0_TRICX|nr:DDE_3 domain-containing protein [Trichonephila clavipes]
MARDMGITDRSVRRIAETELRYKHYKLRKVRFLTEKNKLLRLRKCQKLLRQATSLRWERFLSPDEIFFMVQQVHNSQNDKFWVFGSANWTFQQDAAPAQKAKKIQEGCKVNFPDMLTFEE